MKYLDVIRLEFGRSGIFGILRFDRKILSNIYTLELPYRENKAFVSCIPGGQYKARLTQSPTKGLAIEILNVPNRTHILFHVGNNIHDLKGCIAVGSHIGDNIANSKGLVSERGLVRSKCAVDKLIKLLASEEFGVRVYGLKTL